MGVHDWTRVEVGIFHDFHTVWIGLIRSALNEGLLPDGFYALAEQHSGDSVADILTLHDGPRQPGGHASSPDFSGGLAVADAPPRVRRRQIFDSSLEPRQRTLAIRHVSGHRLIAMLEIVSPGNKDRPKTMEKFLGKALAALQAGVSLLVVDLFPPGPHDPCGIQGEIIDMLSDAEPYELPPGEPLTLTAFTAGRPVESFTEHLAVGQTLPEMPLFLNPDRYVNVPLEQTFQATYRGTPAFWRDALEGKSRS